MPRAKRLDLPGVARHVVQRGNDRQACFFETEKTGKKQGSEYLFRQFELAIPDIGLSGKPICGL